MDNTPFLFLIPARPHMRNCTHQKVICSFIHYDKFFAWSVIHAGIFTQLTANTHHQAATTHSARITQVPASCGMAAPHINCFCGFHLSDISDLASQWITKQRPQITIILHAAVRIFMERWRLILNAVSGCYLWYSRSFHRIIIQMCTWFVKRNHYLFVYI